jgi:hypothetical protein
MESWVGVEKRKHLIERQLYAKMVMFTAEHLLCHPHADFRSKPKNAAKTFNLVCKVQITLTYPGRVLFRIVRSHNNEFHLRVTECSFLHRCLHSNVIHAVLY